jgi:NADPH:quinone reductase-like Zn-dependent oxidoreductase
VSSRLIAAGAGAVGRYAVQMAKLRGAYVVTTVSDTRHSLRLDPGYEGNFRATRRSCTVPAMKF